MKKNGAVIQCQTCGKGFYCALCHIRSGKKYCSMKCRNTDPVFLVTFKRNSNTVLLNATQKGQHHPRWKGGRTITPLGYVAVNAPRHPRAGIGGRYVFEHILVMEKHLNRELDTGEVVHHLNGNKQDNRIENLALMTKREHDSHHGNQADMVYVRRCRAQKRSLT